MMGKKKYTIDPVGRNVKFKFDKDSTKDFGGMVIDRKVTIDAINKPTGPVRKERPSFGGKPKKTVVTPPKGGPNGGSRSGMGNKNNAMNKDAGRGSAADRWAKYRSDRKKSVKKRPPIVIDPRF